MDFSTADMSGEWSPSLLPLLLVLLLVLLLLVLLLLVLLLVLFPPWKKACPPGMGRRQGSPLESRLGLESRQGRMGDTTSSSETGAEEEGEVEEGLVPRTDAVADTDTADAGGGGKKAAGM
jgi:hypothetical protein